jgi:hypothetical protein
VQVGEGRGFVIEVEQKRMVLTAAHCLPHLPPPHPASFLEERTYPKVLGIRGATPDVWAECLFADPIADIAILGQPDNQALPREAESYNRLLESRPPLRLAQIAKRGPAWLLTLEGRWIECIVDPENWFGRKLAVNDAEEGAVAPGTSGSPIVTHAGAVGLVSAGDDMNPVLAKTLPGWLLATLVDG